MGRAQHHKILSLGLLMAFLMNIMLPFFAVYTAPDARSAATDPALSALFGEKIVICTPEGFKLVSLAELEGGEDQSSQATRYECALCYTAAHGVQHVLTEDGLDVIYDEAVQPTFYIARDFQSGPETECQPSHSRAPPKLA